MSQIRTYLIRLKNWLFIEPKYFWWGAVFTLSPIFIFIFCDKNSDNLVRVGVFLQWLGILSIFFSVSKTKQQYKIDSFGRSVSKWWQKKPQLKPKPFVIEPDGITVGMSVSDIKLETVAHWDKSKTFEENIEFLISKLNAYRNEISTLESKLNQSITDNYNKLYTLNSNSENKISNLENVVKSNATGGLNITLIGSLWILIGVTISTIPKDMIFILNLMGLSFQN